MIKKYKQSVCILYIIIFSAVYAQSVQDMQKMKKEYEEYQRSSGGIMNKGLQSSQTIEVDGIDDAFNQPKEVILETYKPKNNLDKLG